MDLQGLLQLMVEKNASDLFLKVGTPPSIRVDGLVEFTENPSSTPEFMDGVLNEVSDERERNHFLEDKELDTAHESGEERFGVVGPGQADAPSWF